MSAALTDLRPEDKAKVGNLLRALARAQRDGQQANAERQEYQDRLRSLRTQNSEIVQETVALRTKFRNSLQLLKTYQHSLASSGAPAAPDDAPAAEAEAVEASADHDVTTTAADEPAAFDEPPAQPLAAAADEQTAEETTEEGTAEDGTADADDDEPQEPDAPDTPRRARTKTMARLRQRFPRAAAACDCRRGVTSCRGNCEPETAPQLGSAPTADSEDGEQMTECAEIDPEEEGIERSLPPPGAAPRAAGALSGVRR